MWKVTGEEKGIPGKPLPQIHVSGNGWRHYRFFGFNASKNSSLQIHPKHCHPGASVLTRTPQSCSLCTLFTSRRLVVSKKSIPNVVATKALDSKRERCCRGIFIGREAGSVLSSYRHPGRERPIPKACRQGKQWSLTRRQYGPDCLSGKPTYQNSTNFGKKPSYCPPGIIVKTAVAPGV